MAQPGPGHPAPTATVVSDLEAALAALHGKMDALREAYHRLAACSPSPLPFAWEDLDAHVSSLLASILLGFRQFRELDAASTAPAAPAAAVGGAPGILDLEEEEKAVAESSDQVSRDQVNACPVGFNDAAAACASVDTHAWMLVRLIHSKVWLRTELRTQVRHAPDRAALSVRAIELFLRDKTIKTPMVWENCVGMIRAVPEVVTELSAESIERAKRVAKDWKEMVDKPGSCMVLGRLASWGLLHFLISYNIVSEFDTREIFHLFGTVPRKKFNKHSAMFFEGLGLNDKIPELMDYLVGNGQLKDVLYLARLLKLVEKYPPLSLLEGCVKKAKQTAMEISEKNMTRQSLHAVITKEIDNLKKALELAKEQITDSSLCTGIKAEIYVLLGEFERRKWILANASTASI